MYSPLSFIGAFIGGLVSFLSPCVLPIVPGFLSYLAGTTVSTHGKGRWYTFLASVFFVLGFSSVFSVLGVLVNTLSRGTGYELQLLLSRIGGIVIILFGLFLMRLVRIPYLEREHRISVKSSSTRSRHLTSFLFGAAFAAGWSPCVGAVLGAIISLAATNPGSAGILFFGYSIGLGVPFLLVGIFASQADVLITKIAPYLEYINFIFGLILLVLGVLAFTQNLTLIANFDILNQYLISR